MEQGFHGDALYLNQQSVHELPRASRVGQERYFYHMYHTAADKCLCFIGFWGKIDPVFFFLGLFGPIKWDWL